MENPADSLTDTKPSAPILDEKPAASASTRSSSPFVMNTMAKQYLDSIPIHHLLPDDQTGPTATPGTAFSAHPYVAWVYNTDPVDTALSTCAAFRVSSCPVWNGSLQKCVGLIDLNDIVTLVANISDRVIGSNFVRSISSGEAEIAKKKLDMMSDLWRSETVQNVMNLSGRNPMIPLPYNSTLYDAVEILAQGIHRMPLMSPNNDDVIAIVSQSLVIQFLADHLDKLGEKPKLLVHQILAHEERDAVADPMAVRNPYHIVSVAQDDLVIDAFRKIRDEQISGVAVLDQRTRYRMEGVISTSDIKSVIIPGVGFHSLLYGQAGEFIKFLQQQNDTTVGPIIACTPIETLGMAVTKLVDNGIHRVFVVRSYRTEEHPTLLGNVPMSVLSPTNVLVELLRD